MIERRYACPRCFVIVDKLTRIQVITSKPLEVRQLTVCDECIDELQKLDPPRVGVTIDSEYTR